MQDFIPVSSRSRFSWGNKKLLKRGNLCDALLGDFEPKTERLLDGDLVVTKVSRFEDPRKVVSTSVCSSKLL
jgi:hypothetical protein